MKICRFDKKEQLEADKQTQEGLCSVSYLIDL